MHARVRGSQTWVTWLNFHHEQFDFQAKQISGLVPGSQTREFVHATNVNATAAVDRLRCAL